MITNRILLTLVLAVVALTGAGCGGGGGGGSDNLTAAEPLTTSVIRTYQQGDTVTGTSTIKDLATGEQADGTFTEVIGGIVKNPFGKECRSSTLSGTFTGPGGTVTISVESLIYQDADNSLYECGEFDDTLPNGGGYVFLTGTPETPDGLFLSIKSPVQLGDITSGTVTLDDGTNNTWQDCTATVLSKENVSVPAGLYESYKIDESCSYSDLSTSTGTRWFVPSIYFMKEVGTTDGVDAEFVVTDYNYK
jgi:hypothetical protein